MKLQHTGNCILFNYTPNPTQVFGFFDEDDHRIYINSKLGLLERECVYFHELTHRDCFLKNCKCRKCTYWEEYHAMRGEFQGVLNSGNKHLKKAYLRQLERANRKFRNNKKVWGKHLAALNRLKKTKAFKEFIVRGKK